jgi:hypothetical protein
MTDTNDNGILAPEQQDCAEPLRCNQCGGVAEEERRCYATPLCFACLPPPIPLPVRALAGVLGLPDDWYVEVSSERKKE